MRHPLNPASCSTQAKSDNSISSSIPWITSIIGISRVTRSHISMLFMYDVFGSPFDTLEKQKKPGKIKKWLPNQTLDLHRS